MTTLERIKKELSDYYTEFKTSDILVVSETHTTLPFAFIIQDKSQPKLVFLSLAIDYNNNELVSDLSLRINKIKPLINTECFFINQMGQTCFGEEAEKFYAVESQVNLEELESPSDYLH